VAPCGGVHSCYIVAKDSKKGEKKHKRRRHQESGNDEEIEGGDSDEDFKKEDHIRGGPSYCS